MFNSKIWSVAKYELLTLSRSWFFRIFGLLAFIVLFFYNLAVQTDVTGFPPWDLNAIPSGIPYTNMLWLNMAQAIIAAFLASDFLKRDKKLDTTEVIYMRSMTNVAYVLGKTLGSFLIFMGINLVILTMAAIFNLLSHRTGFDFFAYIQYLVLISIPTLVFIMGLSYLLMSFIRNQGITFILLLGYIALTVFYLKGKVYYLFDYMAYNVPMIKSDFTGFGDIYAILIQRGIYLFSGLGFIFLTIVFLKRLPQSRFANQLSLFVGLVAIGFSVYLGFKHVNQFKADQGLRAEIISLNNRLVESPIPQIIRNNIVLQHSGNSINVESTITLKNKNSKALSELIMSLNPGLNIDQVTSEGRDIPFSRDHHIITIKTLGPIASGDSVIYTINYHGSIIESAGYLDITEKERQEATKYYQNRFGFISPNYVLLTPELNWYPVSGVTFSTSSPAWMHEDFTYFTLEVKTRADLISVSQGQEEKTDEGTRFVSEYPISKLSLSIGDYAKKSFISDNIEFYLYYKKDHDFFVDALPELKDTIGIIIAERFKDYERRINMDYPFKRFSLVEVPIQFTSYQHIWSEGFENVQPEMVFFPEMGANIRQADLAGNVKGFKKRRRGPQENMSEKDMQARILNNFCAVFTDESGRMNFRMQAGNLNVNETPNYFNIFPTFYAGSNYIFSNNWPIINRVFEAYIKSSFTDMRSTFMRQYTGLSEDEKASMELQERSFAEILTDPEQKQIIDNVIKLKSEVLFSTLKLKAGEDIFDNFMDKFLQDNHFRSVDFNEFNQELLDNFNIDLNNYMENWFNSSKLPGFVFSPVIAEQVKHEGMVQTMIHFKVTNPE
ncbi:MAG: hypothetical protein J7L04_05000, partial [Bacteroidales bacterium]|nr:hypothetical protein [Bacteroidales bacterium]